MKKRFLKYSLFSVLIALFSSSAFAMPPQFFNPSLNNPVAGPDTTTAIDVFFVVREADLLAHATPLCTVPNSLSCTTSVCEALYLDCAFGTGNLNGCDQPSQGGSGTVVVGFIPEPGEHSCLKDLPAIQEACDTQIESFLSKAKTTCEPEEEPLQENSSPGVEPEAAGGCSMIKVAGPTSPFNLMIVFAAVGIPLVFRLKKK